MPTDLASPTGQLTLQFLAWVAEAPRSYRQTMEAWRTSCPRMPVWEDAVDDGLVVVDQDSVRLSPAGAALLRHHG
jgi:hypothetical protein